MSKFLSTKCLYIYLSTKGLNKCLHSINVYNMLQHTAAHCSTLQHTAAHCSTLRLSISRSSVRFRPNPENSNSHGFELHRPSIKGTKILLKVITHHHHHRTARWMSTTHCTTLKYAVTHCHTLTHCSAPWKFQTKLLHYFFTSNNKSNLHFTTQQYTATHVYARRMSTTHCNTLQHTAIHSNTLQRTPTHCSTPQHTATHVYARSKSTKTRHVGKRDLTIFLSLTLLLQHTLQHTLGHALQHTLQHTNRLSICRDWAITLTLRQRSVCRCLHHTAKRNNIRVLI